MSRAVPNGTGSASPRDRALAVLLGLQGLSFMAIYPLGPQQTRLWSPGVAGIAASVAAFPCAALFAAALARRMPALPSTPRSLALLGLAAVIPTVLSRDYASFMAARALAGFAAGLGHVAMHRRFGPATSGIVNRVAPMVVAFGLPVCVVAATALDWRALAAPMIAGYAWLAFTAKDRPHPAVVEAHPHPGEPPLSWLAQASLAFITSACLTVLSGFLVFNTGHSEWLIPVVLTTAAICSLLVSRGIAALAGRAAAGPLFTSVMTVSAASLAGLLVMNEPAPAWLAVAAVAGFLAVGTARHAALAGLVASVKTAATPAWTRMSPQYSGSAAGALVAGAIVTRGAGGPLTGLPALLGCCAVAVGIAWIAGMALVQAKTSPVARAASANNR